VSESCELDDFESASRKRAEPGGSGGCQNGDAVRAQAPCGERERSPAGLVNPLNVVEEDEDRHPLGGRRQEAKRGRCDDECVAGLRRCESKRAFERLALRLWELPEVVEERAQQLVQSRKGDVALRLDASGANHSDLARAVSRPIEQHGLADPRLPDEGEPVGTTELRGLEQGLDPLAFSGSTEELQASDSQRLRVIISGDDRKFGVAP